MRLRHAPTAFGVLVYDDFQLALILLPNRQSTSRVPIRLLPASEGIRARIELHAANADMYKCGREGCDDQIVVSGESGANIRNVRQGHEVPVGFVRNLNWIWAVYGRELTLERSSTSRDVRISNREACPKACFLITSISWDVIWDLTSLARTP